MTSPVVAFINLKIYFKNTNVSKNKVTSIIAYCKCLLLQSKYVLVKSSANVDASVFKGWTKINVPIAAVKRCAFEKLHKGWCWCLQRLLNGLCHISLLHRNIRDYYINMYFFSSAPYGFCQVKNGSGWWVKPIFFCLEKIYIFYFIVFVCTCQTYLKKTG